MISMRAFAVSLAALALLAAGCGGSVETRAPATGGESAAVAPADVAAWLAVDTNTGSEQWDALEDLLERFPDGDELLDRLFEKLGDGKVDVEGELLPAVGDELGIAVLEGEDAVLLMQPDDSAKIEALLREHDKDFVKATRDGWTLYAERQPVLDAFLAALAKGSLAESTGFENAMDGLTGDALAKAYVDGGKLAAAQAGTLVPGGGAPLDLGAFGLAVAVGDGELRVEGAGRATGRAGESYAPALLDRAPADAILAASFHGPEGGITASLRNSPLGEQVLPMLKAMLGVEPATLDRLLAGEGLLYVRPGLPFPEVTLALETDDEARAKADLGALVRSLAGKAGAKVGSATVDGLDAGTLEVSGVRLAWATTDGTLLLTTGVAGFRTFLGDGDKLVDEQRFAEAAESAGVGDELGGLLYVDLQQAIPLVDGLAALQGGDGIPADVRAYLEPLDTLLAHGAAEGGETRFSAVLRVR